MVRGDELPGFFQVNWRIGKTAHFTRTEIFEAVADSTIRVQPNEVLAFAAMSPAVVTRR